jgi:hypothetical protein
MRTLWMAVSVAVFALATYVFQPIPWMAATSTPPPLPIFLIRAITAELLLRASRAIMPSTIVGLTDAGGHMTSMALYVACKRKLADIIGDGAIDVTYLAQLAKVDPVNLTRLLLFLQATGYLCVEGPWELIASWTDAQDRTFASLATDLFF